MHHIIEYGHKLWAWLLADNAVRLTAVLVIITTWYAILTWRMAKAIALQTRAMCQPIALLTFHWNQEQWYPVGYFEVKNLGTQPLLLLDVKLACHFRQMGHFRSLTNEGMVWDEHIIPPGESLRPEFDFKRQFERENFQWGVMGLSYSLEVVASDLSKQIVLTYRNVPVVGLVSVSKGMPLSVRWRYFVKPLAQRYRRLLYRFRQPKIGV
jgi:hypothetical protein